MDEADDRNAHDDMTAKIDTSVAHPARVYDYWLGGKDNFAADREAAERVLAVTPGLRERVRANRAFLARATRYLAAEAYATEVTPLEAAAGLDLGRYGGLTDTERIVGNLHRAYAELDGHERGSPIDDARCFADMVAFNGGAPLRCLA